MSPRTWLGIGVALVLAALVAVFLALRGSDDANGSKPTTPSIAQSATDGISRGRATVIASVTKDEAGTLRLEGQVVDDQKQPIAGAIVFLAPVKKSVTSEADGSFAFDGLIARKYTLDARKDELFSDRTRVQLDETSEPVILTMRRGATLVVTVTDGTAPFAGATLELDQFVTATTDERGIATLRGLGPHFHHVSVTAAGFAPTSVSVTLAELPGEIVERTVTLQRGAPISGTVLGPDGTPVANAAVDISGSGRYFEGVLSTDTGAFTFASVPKGTFALHATSDTFGAAPDLAIEHDGAAPKTGIVLRVIVGAQLVGKVVDEKGTPIAGASVLVAMGTSESYDDYTGRDGRFAFLGIHAGTYRVLGRSSRAASQPTEVAIANDERVDVTLVVKESSIAGIVVDPKGEPVQQARVRAMPVDALSPARSGDDITDSKGHFDLGALEPGSYRVSASWAEQNDRRLGKGDVIATGTRDVKIVLPFAATLTGRVMFDGTPMPYYGILISEHPQFSWIGTPTSVHSADGRFTLRGIHPATWGIVVIGPGSDRKLVENIKLEEGAVTDIGDVVMPRGLHIRGHVRDGAGALVAGAKVSTKFGFSLADRESVLDSWFKGDYSTTTDASGTFAFEGIAPLHNERRPAELTAEHPTRGISAKTTVPPGDPATVELVLLATGAIDGTVENGGDGNVNASRVGGRESSMAGVDDAGAFHFETLTPGEWKLSMRRPGAASPPSIVVTVVANQRVTAKLVVPKVTVTVVLKITGDCTYATLIPANGDHRDIRGTGACEQSPVQLPKIAPGDYQACADENCVPITVAPSPASQTFEIRAAARPR